MISEAQKDAAGAILFEVVAAAVRESGGGMNFPSWDVLDQSIKANYIPYVERMVEALGISQSTLLPPGEPRQIIEVVQPIEEKDVEPKSAPSVIALENSESTLLNGVRREGIKLSPKKPPEKKRTTKRKKKAKVTTA